MSAEFGRVALVGIDGVGLFSAFSMAWEVGGSDRIAIVFGRFFGVCVCQKLWRFFSLFVSAGRELLLSGAWLFIFCFYDALFLEEKV